MPQLLPESDPLDLTGEESLDAYAAAASTAGGPRFLTGVGDWAQEDLESMDALGDDSTNVGALAAAPEDDDTAFDREVAARRKIKSRPGGAAAAATEPGSAHPRGPSARRVPKTRWPVRPPRPDITTRVITGVGMAVLALICLKLGRDATTVLATAIVGLASLELFQGLQRRGFRPGHDPRGARLASRSCRSPTSGASSRSRSRSRSSPSSPCSGTCSRWCGPARS